MSQKLDAERQRQRRRSAEMLGLSEAEFLAEEQRMKQQQQTADEEEAEERKRRRELLCACR